MTVAEMKILRGMCGVTRLEWKYKKSLGIVNIAGKIRENTLKWFRNVERINYDNIVKKTDEIKVEGNLRRGRLKEK